MNRIYLFSTFAIAVVSTGCPVAEAPEGVVSGVVDKAPVSGARVALRHIADSFEGPGSAETGRTNDAGEFDIDVAAAAATIEVCATDGTYTDEATGQEHNLTSELCAVIREYEINTDVSIRINPYTSFVTAYAKCLDRTGRAGGATAAHDAAIAAFDAFLTIGASDYSPDETEPFPVTTSLAPSLTPEVWAGLLHAGLSQAALRIAEVSGLEPGNRVTASTLTEAIVQDLSDDDCVLDGVGPTGQLMQGDVALNADALRGAPYGLLAGMLEFADYGSNASGITASELRPILAQMASFESPLFGTITRQPDLSPPTVSFVTPEAGTFTGTVEVNVVVEDDSEILSCAFRNFQPLSDLVPDFSEDRTRCTLTGSFNAAELGEGPLTLIVEARDEIGNLVREPLEGIVDNTPPTILVTTPTRDSTVAGIVEIAAIATDPSGIVALTVLDVGVDDTIPGNDTFNGTWDTTAIAEGAFVLVLEAEDANGLIGRLEVPLTIDNLEGRTFSGNVSLGSALSAPFVRVAEYETGTLIAEGDADDDGAFSFVDASAYVGPVKVVATGGTYIDVATGGAFENGATLEAVVTTSSPGDDVRVSVNAATSLAASLAPVLGDMTTDEKIEAANTAIRAHIRRPDTFSLLEEDVATLHTNIVQLSSPTAALGLFHAGLSRMAADLSIAAQGQIGTVSVDQVLAVLQSDIQDGAFDGRLFDNPLSLSLAAFADSYTLRRSLAVSTHLFVTDAPLLGVDEARNVSGIAADALRPVGSFYDDIASNDDPLLFPTAAIPLPFDENPPTLSVAFQAPHAAAALGDALNGDVRMLASATDGSALAHVSILAPDLEDTAGNLATVQVVFRDDVLPNIDVVAPACDVDPTLAPYSLLTEQVCGCFEAEDVLGNVSREMLCFTRPPPQIVRLSPNAANGDVLDGDVDVEFQVIGGFALSNFDIVELVATSPSPTRRRVTVPPDHVDVINAPDVIITGTATDLLGRVTTEAFQFGRDAPVIAVSGVEPGELLQGPDLPRSYNVVVNSGYPMTSCHLIRRFLGAPPSNFENTDMPRSASNRSCTHFGSVSSELGRNGASEIFIEVVDVTGRTTTHAVPYVKDSQVFQSALTSPTFDLVTNALNVNVEGNATESLASVQLTLIAPGGGETDFDAVIDNDTFSFNVPSNAISTQGTYSLLANSTSTTAQSHTTAALNFTVDRTAPTLVPRSTQPTVRNMDTDQPRTTTGVAPDVTIRPAGVESVPSWGGVPSFAIWSPLTNNLSHTPRFVVEAADNFTSAADIEIRYRVASTCAEPQPGSTLAETHFSIIGSGALDVTADVSEVNLTEAGTRQLCLTAVATDRAGNASTMLSRQFSYTTVPPPVFLETNSRLYDSASNPLDFDHYSDDYERLFQNFAVPNSVIESTEFCDSGETTCPPEKIPSGFAYLDAVVVNPWSVPVDVQLTLSGYQGAEVRFETRVLVLKSTIETGAYWGDNPALDGAALRNPRNIDATRGPSVPTQDYTPIAPNTPLPRWETACTSPAHQGVRIAITPPDYPLTTPAVNSCVGPGDPLVQNFQGRGGLTPFPIITQETEQTGETPLGLRQGQTPAHPRFFRLNADRTVETNLSVPVQIPLDENGRATLLPGESAVALWIDSHDSPSEALFDDVSPFSTELEQFCPLLGVGTLFDNGDSDAAVVAADPRSDLFEGFAFGDRPVFKNYGSTPACGTYVLANSSSSYSCTDAGMRCYIDRSWREMTSLSVRLNANTRIIATTTSDFVNAAWSASFHSETVPTIPRSIHND